MKFARVWIGCAAMAACMAASAQYQWIDKDGRKVYSDRPPPADVPAKNVLKGPRGVKLPTAPAADEAQAAAGASAATAAARPAPAPAAAAKAAPAGTDKALEDAKKKAEADEEAKKKAEEQKVAAQRAENCKRAMNSKASLDSGMRMARVNDKGEREVLDDAARAKETQRINQIIQSECK